GACAGKGGVPIVVKAATARWVSASTDAESITVMAGSLALEGQTNWFYYNGGDAPEGAYMGWLFTAPTLSATVRLPTPLLPGRYYLFFYGISYDSNEPLQASIGGGTSTAVTLNDRDANRYWSDGAMVDVATASDILQI